MYFFYQEEEKGVWKPALASERENVIKNKKPALVSVLDVDNDFSSDLTLDEHRAVKYSGPFYVDFDAADLDEATQQFQKFLTNLRAKGVDLNMLRLYATGKKGYHIEVPAQVLMAKVPPNGVAHLPHIYREVAHQLYVDTLDLRVYSAKRGRMWRCQNVKRDNGQYKVQLTVDEAFSMTGETYAQVCSTPRNSLPVEPPALNPELGLLFASAKDKVEKGISKAKSRSKTEDQLRRFKGEWPETLGLLLSGVGLKEDVGWNYISLQLAVTASALGKSEEQLLIDAEPLINGHKGDSDRYGTARKRRLDLQQMFRYVNGNPCYEYSVGGVMALVQPELRANADIAFGEWSPPAPEQKEDSAPAAEGGDTVTVIEEDEDEDGAIRVDRSGIWVRGEEGYKNVCHLGFTLPVSMRKLDDSHIGYEVQVTLDGKKLGTKHLPMAAFCSRSQFNNWALNLGASMKASDAVTGALADVFRKKAAKRGAPTYALEREGIDIVVPPGSTDPSQFDIVWAAPDGVIATGKTKYRYHGHYSDQGMFRTDLMTATELTADDRQFFVNLFNTNTEQNMAKFAGWFSAAFLTQIIRKLFGKFPILQVFGQAEAGKSHTIKLWANLHYFLKTPKTMSVAGMTPFPIIAATATSASIPVIFEEVKPRQIGKNLKDLLQSILRSNYTADELSRGSLGRDKAVRELTVTEFANAAPIAFVGEAIEDQSAILARCVVVAMNKSDRVGKRKEFEACRCAPHILGKLGKKMALSAMAIDQEQLRTYVQETLDQLADKLPYGQADETIRALFNLAVTITGLEFLKTNLASEFGNSFNEVIDSMKQSLVDNVSDNLVRNMAEASRVLDVMAQLSRSQDVQYQIVQGQDYTLNDDGATMDLKLKPAYAKYVRYQRSLGMEVLFDSESAFLTGMANYGGTVSRACLDNQVLFDSPKAVVYRLSIAYMDKEGVDAFRN